MSKIRKSFLRGSAMMLAVMALSSGVAQAQECFAFQSSPTTVRAEGMTEMMGGVLLQCRHRTGFGVAPLPAEFTVSVKLNTHITNETNDDGQVMGLTYTEGSPSIPGNTEIWTGEDKQVLSGGDTIEWTIDTGATPTDGEIGFPDTEAGGSITIGGIMANASAVGDGNDVTAEIRVNGVMVEHSPIKLADVTTGLEIEVTSATGLQCSVASGSTAVVATVFFKEGFNDAIKLVEDDTTTADVDESDRSSALVLSLSGVPDGVTVTASMMGTGTPLADPGDATDLAPLMLRSGGHDMGEVEIEDGSGQVVYDFVVGDYDHDGDGTDFTSHNPAINDALGNEWNEVTLTFTWEAGGPALGMASVMAGYHPVGGDDTPRYVAGAAMDALEVEDCDTSMLFPFVTNMHGFDTGVAITNTSDVDGSCMVEYSGDGAPMDAAMVMVGAGSTTTFGLSMMAPGFQGYIDVTCDYRNAKGLAFITNGAGSPGGPSLAHGYVVGEDLESSD